MLIIETLPLLRQQIRRLRMEGKRVALVPTMGNLHDGHMKLVDEAKARADVVVVSIFVNPMQFDRPEDLARYPRTLQEDCEKLNKRKVDLVFAPSVKEIYPNGTETHTYVDVPGLSTMLEGASRPGHFRGVSTIVSKLFNLVQPDIACFGEKDFQQLALIRKMVADMGFDIEIVGVPIMRAKDGLALSSRNGYLTAEQRKIAPGLYKVLSSIADKLQAGERDLDEIIAIGVEFYSKALRQTAIQATIELAQKPIVLIGGCTGSGKTLLVQQQPNGVDLEGLARHRGSAFGRTLQPQLSQASFENLLAAEMLKTDAHQDLRLWVLEDESRMIGSNHLPECLRERMTQATIAVVEDPFEIRLERLNEEYFLRMHHDFTHAYGDEQGWQEYCEYLHHGLSAIKRRLGLQRYNELAARLDAALTTQLTTGSTDGHLAWLVPLLEEYYDPMYRYQLEKKAEKVVFRGEWAEVAEWVKAR